MKNRLGTLLAVAGVAALIFGLYLWSPAAAWIVGGFSVYCFGVHLRKQAPVAPPTIVHYRPTGSELLEDMRRYEARERQGVGNGIHITH